MDNRFAVTIRDRVVLPAQKLDGIFLSLSL